MARPLDADLARHAAAAPPAAALRGLRDRALATDGLLGAALVAAVAAIALQPIVDHDLWWHLESGKRVLGGYGVPWADSFSYVASGRPWIAYSWLAEVVFAALHRAFGPGALVTLEAALLATTFGLVWRTCRLGARPFVAVAVTFLAALVSSVCWTVRPHLFSFLCLAAFSHVLALASQRGIDRRWLLVPVMALWANTHILFPFGLVLLGLHAAPRALRGWREGRPPWREAAVAAAVAAATLATPYGWHLIRYVGVMAGEPTFPLVVEFQTPSLHAAPGLLLTLLFFATSAALILSPARKDPADVAGFFCFALLAYLMGRNIPFFAIVAAPVLARHLDALLPPVVPAPPAPGRAQRRLHAAVLAAATALVVQRAASLYAPGAAVDPTQFPIAAVSFLRAEPPLGRLLNDFDWGGYLIGNLYPAYRVAMDGRTQVYGQDTLREYRAMAYLEPGWRGFLARTDPDVVLWPKRGPFARALELLPEWTRVYDDGLALVFVRTDHPSRPRLAGALR